MSINMINSKIAPIHINYDEKGYMIDSFDTMVRTE